MPIRLKNTLTRKIEEFTPIDKEDVRMYVCGPTVYDRAHLGNARPVVVFDILYRLLRNEYGAEKVRYVRNFTDVDDKINARAAQTGRHIGEITEETIGWFHDDMDALGALRPTQEPRATQYIKQMQDMISELIDKDMAYPAEGHVLFRVRAYEKYGALSGRSVDDMIAGARVEVAPFKEDPMDFVLWKPSTGDTPGWDSPWGYGRPGWHIECSAMSRDLLGDRFDIHGGGLDLQFPHHENEIAQTKACCGEDSFAQIWMHNEMLQVEGKKMSKSLGNFFTVRELLDQGWPGEVIRFVMLSTHYTKPMDWTEKKASDSELKLRSFHQTIGQYADVSLADESKVSSEVFEALSEDLNTSLALSYLDKSLKEAKRNGCDRARVMQLAHDLKFLGLLMPESAQTPRPFWVNQEIDVSINDQALIETLMKKRAEAKEDKNWARADQIRDGLAAAGVLVKDGKEEAAWELTPDFDPSKLKDL